MRRNRRAPRSFIALLALLALVAGFAANAPAQSAITYLYDENGRLKAVIDPSADPASNVAIYNYDAVGNITSIERRGAATTSVLSFSPACSSAGTPVTISGTGFSTTPNQNTVTINGVAATVTAATATELKATVPAGATSGPIAVTAPGGSASSPRTFTVGCAPPTITGFNPTIALAGTPIVVDGTNFDPAPPNNRLAINVMAGSISAATATRLDTAVPPNGRSGRISVGTLYGTATSTGDLYVPPSPYVVADAGTTLRMPFPGSQVVSIPANKIALVLFDGTQAKRASMQITNDQLPGFKLLSLYPPLALPPVSGSGSSFIEPMTLVGTGTFTVLVDPSGTSAGSFTLNLYDVPQDPIYTAIIDGPAVAVATTAPGQNAEIFFDGAAGQRVSMRKTNSTYTSFTPLSVYAPNGTVLRDADANDFVEPVTLTAAGQQRILLNPQVAGTGALNLTLYDVQPDVSGTLTLNGPAAPAVLVDPGQNASFTFVTTAPNQPVTVRVTSNTFTTNGCTWVRLYKPGNVQATATIGCTASFNLAQQTLATVDTYTVVVDPRFWNTGSLNVAVTTP